MPVGRSGSPAQQATSATQSPGHETRQLSRAALQPHMSCSRSAPPRREAKAASSHHAAPHQPPPLLAGHNDTGSHMSVTEPTIKICTKRGSSPAQEILRGGYCGAHAKVQNFFFTFFFPFLGVLSLSCSASLRFPTPRVCVLGSHPIPASRNPAPNPPPSSYRQIDRPARHDGPLIIVAPAAAPQQNDPALVLKNPAFLVLCLVSYIACRSASSRRLDSGVSRG